MSILAALARAYDRLETKPDFGFGWADIAYCLVLDENGDLIGPPVDLRDASGKKPVGRRFIVPTSLEQRTSGIAANFLWDKSAYALGVSQTSKRVDQEHAEFVRHHGKISANSNDLGLIALNRFLVKWLPARFADERWPQELVDENIVFAIEDASGRRFVQDSEGAKAAWKMYLAEQSGAEAICLVMGEERPVARSHSPIKGVRDAQSSGAFLVSFNAPAFTSYGHEQGDNAPVSELAAFKYTTALNTFLAGKRNRIQIGDTSTVYWADVSGHVATEAELVFAQMFGGDPLTEASSGVNEPRQAERVGEVLERVRRGMPWLDATRGLIPDLAQGVRFFVLGLAPNAARISIRFWFEDDFGVLAENYRRFVEDMRIAPGPKADRTPTLKRMLLRTAPARREPNGRIKFDQDRVPALLAGEFFRSILTGDRFPGMLLGQLLQRVRSDGLLDHLRVSLIKATIVRAMRLERRLPIDAQGKTKEDYLVRSDPNDPNDARRLGRLFALIERAQLAALGDEINSTVTDKFLGTCAATPQQVISKLVLNAQEHHLKRLRNGHSDAKWITDSVHAKRVGAGLNRDIGQLYGSFENGFPAQHSNEEQGLFLVGYYQERYGRSSAGEDGAPPVDADRDAADLGEE